MSLAWETTEEDVQNVLTRMGRSDLDAEVVHGSLDHGAIEKAALRGDGMDEQTDGAHEEIKRQIREIFG